MPSELDIARESNKEILILLAYGKKRDSGWGWRSSDFLECYSFCDVSIDNLKLDISKLVSILTGFELQESESLTGFSHIHLQAEYLIDKAFTEQYEAVFLNRRSNEPLRLLNQAIEIDPNYAEAYFHRGELNREGRNWGEKLDEIIEDYSKAIELDDTNPRYFDRRGGIFERKGYYEKALKDYSIAISLAPLSNISYSSRALIYRKYGKLDLAIQDLSLAIEINPDGDWLWSTRGVTFHKLGDLEQSISDLTQSLALKDRWVNYVYRGIVYEDAGQLSKAEDDWELAVTIAKRAAGVARMRAGIYRSRGQIQKALTVLDEYLKANPEDQTIRKLKNHIINQTE